MGLRREMLSVSRIQLKPISKLSLIDRKHKDPNKAQRYLQLLDQARCSGNWEEVSKLKLKIAKHAPDRKCT